MATNTLYIKGIIDNVGKPDANEFLEYHPLNVYMSWGSAIICGFGFIVAMLIDWVGPSRNPFMVYQDKANAEIDKARDKYNAEKAKEKKKN